MKTFASERVASYNIGTHSAPGIVWPVVKFGLLKLKIKIQLNVLTVKSLNFKYDQRKTNTII